MTSKREELRRKFAGTALMKVAVRPELARRADFKGERGRLNLRVPLDVMADLELVKLAAGVDKNDFCVDVMTKAVRKEVLKIKAGFDAAGWKAITHCAKARD